ncbi:MAG: hypothetical protein SWH61_03115 [Thermodesulfobacteriota bacterium]|nr:hypothetical protein [Thermodesulfobacteriota bacterium]
MPSRSRKNIQAERRLIVEMINASMKLAYEKGPHPLTPGCNCIACVNRRKRKLAGAEKPWRYRL